MKETPLSLCERSSVISFLQNHLRLDGRSFYEMRPIEIQFGKDYGCCIVSLGETRVLAQVTSEVVEPRPSRPNEGKLSISVHLSPMAASHFELGRSTELVDELQQLLDRNIKESRCVDVESLCILAEESVWQLKVDVTILNHAGNLGDAANLAAVAALRHFHRPDVTVEEDGRVTIHTHEERELIPTFLKKIPVCLTYGLFMVDKQCVIVLDPTEKEERVTSGKFVVGLNPHGEITSLLFPGKVCLEKHTVMSCVSKAFGKAKAFAEKVMSTVEEDIEKRKVSVKTDGFLNVLTGDAEYAKAILLERVRGVRGMEIPVEAQEEEPMDVKEVKPQIEIEAEVGAGGARATTGARATAGARTGAGAWAGAAAEEDEGMGSSDEEFSAESLRKNLDEIRAAKKAKTKALKPESMHLDDDEMETKTTTLCTDDTT